MRKSVFSIGLCAALGLASCTTLDGRVAELNANVQKYCASLETAATLADVLANKPLVTKINSAIASYCSSPINDLPSAIIALANIMKAVNAAGINP
jgi:hypothetical protein